MLIAVFKFVKGALLLTLAFGALSLLHKDVASEVEHWLDQLRIDPDNQFIGTFLSKLQLVHTKELKEMSALGAGYAAVFLVEGTRSTFPETVGGMADDCCDKFIDAVGGL